VTFWEHEFALSFVNDGHFRVTDPGPLHAPVLDFSVRRNEDLELIIETQASTDSKSTATKHPSGTARITTESVGLENVGGMKVKLTGVIPFGVRTSTNFKTGQSQLIEEAQIHELEACAMGSRPVIRLTGWKICRSARSSAGFRDDQDGKHHDPYNWTRERGPQPFQHGYRAIVHT
jgi:hypothetical protein